jgi:two-component system phosphate regulon sensor histidine kinase PhoR
MASWSLKWRILAETAALVAVMGVAAVAFGITGAVVAGIVLAVVAFYRANQLSKLFQQMTEGVLRAASINRDHRIQPGGPAELDRMARAVNRLADRLVAAMEETGRERGRLGAILDSMAEGVMVVDQDGGVEFANPTSLFLLGYANPFKPGSHLSSLNNNFELNEIATRCAETGEPRQAQIDVRTSGRFIQALATPMTDRDGERKSVLILTDLTDVRKTEITRREFVSNASHELRTPIAAIKAAAETLQRGAAEDPAARKDFLERILGDTTRMEAMVQEMLELSRLESGQTPLHITPVAPAAFLDDVCKRFTPLAEKSHSHISVLAKDGAPTISVDRMKFEQVFANLVTNALNAMPDGGTIRIEAGESTDDPRRVVFTVADNGPGISQAHLPHIFERFYKVDSSRSAGGTGLGLAIAKHIVQAHGGDISVQSRPGSGTKFKVSMPATGR